jgi:hypothetical protein
LIGWEEKSTPHEREKKGRNREKNLYKYRRHLVKIKKWNQLRFVGQKKNRRANERGKKGKKEKKKTLQMEMALGEIKEWKQ